jgi:hypothetical protein
MTDVLSAPDRKAGRLQRECLERLKAQEAQPDGLPTSVRFIYYELVQAGIVAKKDDNGGNGGQLSDQPVAVAIFRLRELGLVPWNWIAEEIRTLFTFRYDARLARGAP